MPRSQATIAQWLKGVIGGSQRSVNALIGCETTTYDTGNQTVNNSTTLVTYANMSLDLGVGFYKIHGLLPIGALAAANNIKIGIAGGTCNISAMGGYMRFTDNSNHIQEVIYANPAAAVNGGTTDVWTMAEFDLTLQTTIPGTFQIQFAQNVAANTDTTLGTFCRMIAKPLDHQPDF